MRMNKNKIFDYIKLRKKYNKLKLNYEILEEYEKNKTFKKILEKFNESEKLKLLTAENKYLRAELKRLKNIIMTTKSSKNRGKHKNGKKN